MAQCDSDNNTDLTGNTDKITSILWLLNMNTFKNIYFRIGTRDYGCEDPQIY